MAADELKGARVAILVTDGFEQIELTSPRDALMAAGALTDVVAPKEDTVQGWNHREVADAIPVDKPLNQASPDDYDALLLPGGVINPDKLRQDESAVAFVRKFFVQGKPVAAICHGAQTLIDAEVVKGRRMTSYWSIQTDLRNAGAEWVDEPVVVDGNLITSRHPQDLEAFNAKLTEGVAQGRRAGQHA